jgi:hypothetical protein
MLFDDTRGFARSIACRSSRSSNSRPRDEFPTIHFSKNTSETTASGDKSPPRSSRKKRLQPLAADAIVLGLRLYSPRRRVANNIAMSSPVNRCREKSFCDFHDRFTPASLAGAELSASRWRVLELVYWPAIKTAGRLGAISFERDSRLIASGDFSIMMLQLKAPQRTRVTGSE